MEWFAQEFLYRCSYWRASAYVGGPNPHTWEDIYHNRSKRQGTAENAFLGYLYDAGGCQYEFGFNV